MSLELLSISLQIAVFSVVFSCILIEEGMIFSFYGRFLDRLPTWIGHPLGRCVYCLSGQVAVWYFIYRMFYYTERYDPFIHLSFIAITILFTHLILFIYERTN